MSLVGEEPEVLLDQAMPRELSVEVAESLGEEEMSAYWDMISSGFQELNSSSILKQDMTREEFIEDCQSESVIKFTAKRGNERVAFMSVHSDIEDISWVDTFSLRDFARRSTRDSGEAQDLLYVGTLIISPGHRGLDTAIPVIRNVGTWLAKESTGRGNQLLLFFDNSAENAFLPKLIQRTFESIAHESNTVISIEHLGTHSWYLDTVEPKGSSKLNSYTHRLDGISETVGDELFQEYLLNYGSGSVGKPRIGRDRFIELIRGEKTTIYAMLDAQQPCFVMVDDGTGILSNEFMGKHQGVVRRIVMSCGASIVNQQALIAEAVHDGAMTQDGLPVLVVYDCDQEGTESHESLLMNNPQLAIERSVMAERQQYWAACVRPGM